MTICTINNFYTSLRLANYPVENGTKATGTLMENIQQLPVELKNTILQKGEPVFYQDDCIVIVKCSVI